MNNLGLSALTMAAGDSFKEIFGDERALVDLASHSKGGVAQQGKKR